MRKVTSIIFAIGLNVSLFVWAMLTSSIRWNYSWVL